MRPLRKKTPVVRRQSRISGSGRGDRIQNIPAMRRAMALYLASRNSATRDLVYVMLPETGRRDGDERLPGRSGIHPGAADVIVWTKGRAMVVGLAPVKTRSRLAQDMFSGALRRFGHEYRLIRAETPAHAVEQLAKLIDGPRP